MRRSGKVVIGGAVVGGLVGARLLRRASADEGPLPGDEVFADATRVATRSVRVAAAPEAVWPWVAQLGQNKAGFYSWTALENLVGCRMPERHEVVAEWQQVAVGDRVHLHPDMFMVVERVEDGRALVLRTAPGGVPGGEDLGFDFSWAFVVEPERGGTRLLTRERYRAGRAGAKAMTALGTTTSAVMSHRMLRTIARLAEGR